MGFSKQGPSWPVATDRLQHVCVCLYDCDGGCGVTGMAQHAAPGASTRLGRAPWNSGIGASNGAGAPPPAGPGAGRVRQARTGAGAAHPPAPNNGHGARTKHVISDSALKEASAAVERAMRPARTVSVPERKHPGPLNLPHCPFGNCTSPVNSPSPRYQPLPRVFREFEH